MYTHTPFVCYLPTAASNNDYCSILSWRICICILIAYESLTVHSTQATAASAAFSTNAPIGDIGRAATWASPSTRHYKIDLYSLAEASFGHKLL